MSELDLANAPVLEDETLIERRYRFLTQRLAGGTFRAIAERYNREAVSAVTGAGRDPSEAKTVSPATVRKDVEWAKRDITDGSTREALVAEENQTLMLVRQANFPAMLTGDVDAGKLVLATVAQRRELWGLDAPKRAQIGVGTDVEFASDLVELITAIGGTAPKDLVFAAHSERPALDVPTEAPLDVDTVPDRSLLDVTAPDPRPEPATTAATEEEDRERRDGDYWHDGDPWSNL